MPTVSALYRIDPKEAETYKGIARVKLIIEREFGVGAGFQFWERRGTAIQFNDPDEFNTPTIFLVYPCNAVEGDTRIEIVGWLTRDQFMNHAKAFMGKKIAVSSYKLNSMIDPQLHNVKHT